jgi:GrpB-like predicted nucleotidyltransferase (UPF0157 family)
MFTRYEVFELGTLVRLAALIGSAIQYVAMRKMEVQSYDPAWPLLYRAEAARLTEAFGAKLMAIHHIGSTSVPGLAARPTIDILVEVHVITAVDALNPALITLGYEPYGEFGIPGRRYFPRVSGETHTHHVHVFQVGDPQSLRHLVFRDYLIAHPDEARAYGRLKTDLAVRFPFDVSGYLDGKDAFIKALERRALDWNEARRV